MLLAVFIVIIIPLNFSFIEFHGTLELKSPRTTVVAIIGHQFNGTQAKVREEILTSLT